MNLIQKMGDTKGGVELRIDDGTRYYLLSYSKMDSSIKVETFGVTMEVC